MVRHRFSAEDFHRMGEAGILPEDARVELVQGEVLEMSPVGKRHVYALNALLDLLAPLRGQVVLSVQNPLVLEPETEVYPDLVLLRPPREAYRNRLLEGKDALLVIEVAESSLDYDLRVKVPLYAQAGVPEVWAVDLARDRLQRFLEPQGGAYLRQEVLEEGLVEVFGLSFPLKEVLP
ncbi:MAG: Uma2 family endonuclease [Thermus sp.]|uniref:Uma2 family endonuclease n=1 Tax=Thermus sp. TaxID=275 RepID=UPI0031FAD69E